MGKILTIVGAALFVGMMFVPIFGSYTMFDGMNKILAIVLILCGVGAAGLAVATEQGSKLPMILAIIPLGYALYAAIMSQGLIFFSGVAIGWFLGAVLCFVGGLLFSKAAPSA